MVGLAEAEVAVHPVSEVALPHIPWVLMDREEVVVHSQGLEAITTVEITLTVDITPAREEVTMVGTVDMLISTEGLEKDTRQEQEVH